MSRRGNGQDFFGKRLHSPLCRKKHREAGGIQPAVVGQASGENYDDFRRLRHPDFFRSVITYVIKWCDYVKNHAHIIRERTQNKTKCRSAPTIKRGSHSKNKSQ